MPDSDRLSMRLGEAMFTLRSVRRVKPDPIPDADVRLLLEAATRAPSSANLQPWHFIVVTDPEWKAKLQALYHESWWNWFRSTGQDKLPDPPPHIRGAMWMADHYAEAPLLVLACVLKPTIPNEALAAAQNLLLAARALGIAGTLTRLNETVYDKVRDAFGLPAGVEITYCLRLGYPETNFGTVRRKALSDVCSLNHFGNPF